MISMDKKYKTRDGREVKILTTERKDDYPVVGLIVEDSGIETVRSWPLSGVYSEEHECLADLVETKITLDIEGYFNIYKNDDFSFHRNKARAINASYNRKDLLARKKVKIEIEIGEGEFDD
jgi:hypothetical protein